MILNCPLPAALTTIVASTCAFRFDQIVRVLFQQRQPGASPFANQAAMQVLANWTPLLVAADATKVAPSPIFAGFTIPKSEAQTNGGNDNSTFNGIAEYYGEGTITASGTFKNLTSATLVSLDNLTQFSVPTTVGTSNLTVYFVNKDGYIFYYDGLTGIPVYNFRVGSVGSEGYNRANENDFGLTLPAGWDRKLNVVKPNFDPLTAF